MAEKKNIREEAAAAAETIRLEDREEIFIERAAANEEPNLFVSVNGYNCLLPKGRLPWCPRALQMRSIGQDVPSSGWMPPSMR